MFFCISLFEIYFEHGQRETMFYLSPDGSDLSMQRSTIKGLQEAIISDASHAESLIAGAILKTFHCYDKYSQSRNHDEGSRSLLFHQQESRGSRLGLHFVIQIKESVKLILIWSLPPNRLWNLYWNCKRLFLIVIHLSPNPQVYEPQKNESTHCHPTRY
ncbi:uncharacterized protein LOC119996267 isoform X2 [Tripterygium wilfordii]|uniref:uncharacterized protein LOC119996267 isoform X2 n=1 Tax=Tripterygium wilfordii TaxID=458696 RepID=UPI0018F81991|nr:uncharacterized protein LOC119996267 isoform X2 [Tripterygium wilfordii]XP_038698769.1 uncharacterized protein LOC119996267 isoform X2 [Tripterygium wilfordii]